jgi:dolichol kinase
MRSFQAMDAVDSSPGTVYFAISITVLFLWLWHPNQGVDRVPLAAGAIMVMTWGDGLASLVGGTWGKHPYSILEHERTWEGTITMAVASFAALFLTFTFLPNSALSPNSLPMGLPLILFLSVLGTLVATFAEAVTPAGMDNLTVPLLTGIVLHFVDTLR